MRYLGKVSRRIFSSSAATQVALGAFDGENITGVRISGSLLTASTGGNTTIRIRANGLNPMSVMGLNSYTWWNTTTVASNRGNDLSGNYANLGGMAIALTNFGNSAQSVHFHGVLYTAHLFAGGAAVRPTYVGQYETTDRVVNDQNHLYGDIQSVWNDLSTPITSLTLIQDTGTFSGRISTEVIP